ncbi:helix-turn-helix transcriptional regulator [Streptomyces sp. NPDC051993]|uniref:helix-turn-helix domain-containing protein n=1 Tax=Streptomyces sp. NPDC051993 TaxID=3155286 RepID=UPI003443438A
MGRSEKPITTTNAALCDLAEWLREQRSRAKLTYRRLAERAGLHATTLQRVASGDSVPKLMPVLAYARGCDANAEDARRLWQRARREHLRAQSQPNLRPAPSPALVRDFADLSAALRDLYERVGGPTLRAMEVRAGGFGALPRSCAHRIVNRQSVPHSLSQFRAYLRACDVPEGDQAVWEAAWSRAWRFEKQEDAGLNEVEVPRPGQTQAQDRVAALRVLGGTEFVVRHRPLAPRRRKHKNNGKSVREVLFEMQQLDLPRVELRDDDGRLF